MTCCDKIGLPVDGHLHRPLQWLNWLGGTECFLNNCALSSSPFLFPFFENAWRLSCLLVHGSNDLGRKRLRISEWRYINVQLQLQIHLCPTNFEVTWPPSSTASSGCQSDNGCLAAMRLTGFVEACNRWGQISDGEALGKIEAGWLLAGRFSIGLRPWL